MSIEQEVERITNELYEDYASDTGHLLGLEPKYRNTVQVIVKFVLNCDKGERHKKETKKGFDITKQCPHCDSTDIEYHNYEWFCNNCGEQWNQYGEDTK